MVLLTRGGTKWFVLQADRATVHSLKGQFTQTETIEQLFTRERVCKDKLHSCLVIIKRNNDIVLRETHCMIVFKCCVLPLFALYGCGGWRLKGNILKPNEIKPKLPAWFYSSWNELENMVCVGAEVFSWQIDQSIKGELLEIRPIICYWFSKKGQICSFWLLWIWGCFGPLWYQTKYLWVFHCWISFKNIKRCFS